MEMSSIINIFNWIKKNNLFEFFFSIETIWENAGLNQALTPRPKNGPSWVQVVLEETGSSAAPSVGGFNMAWFDCYGKSTWSQVRLKEKIKHKKKPVSFSFLTLSQPMELYRTSAYSNDAMS